MQHEYWKYDNIFIELLFDSNKSPQEMAYDMGVSERMVRHRIKMMGFDWMPKKEKKMSRGQTALTHVLRKLIPGEQIVNEYHIGEQLRLDIYCPNYKLGVEFHGIQHYKWVSHFHETYDDFVRAQERDERKIQLCAEQGITLVVFRYCDNLTEDFIFDRLLEAIQASPQGDRITRKPKTRTFKGNPTYEAAKTKRRAYERDLRRKIKQERKEREQDRTPQGEYPDSLGEDYNYEWS